MFSPTQGVEDFWFSFNLNLFKMSLIYFFCEILYPYSVGSTVIPSIWFTGLHFDILNLFLISSTVEFINIK